MISDGFGISFPIRVVPKTAEKPFRNGFLRNFWVFHSLHTPYYDYYDFYSSFFPSFFSLPPGTENSVCRFAGLQSGGKKCGYRARLVGEETMLSPSSVAYGATFPLKGEGFRMLC